MSRQAAFRGYRLRDRLRHLPAREAEKTIRALQANGRGFRRLALFLVFFGLYFSLVFGGADVAFQRSVQQGLRDHLALVRGYIYSQIFSTRPEVRARSNFCLISHTAEQHGFRGLFDLAVDVFFVFLFFHIYIVR